MSRFERALAGLQSGRRIVLFDEGRPETAVIVAVDLSADAVPASAALALSAPLDLPEPLARRGLTQFVAVAGGVLVRPALAEAAVDLLAAAGCPAPAFVLPFDEAEAVRLQLPRISIQDVVLERLGRETIVEEAAVAHLPSIHAAGPFDVHAYRGLLDGCEHLAMVHAPQGAGESAPFTDVLPLVRVHSECLTGDALGSLRCDCGDQLRRSLALIAADPVGGAVIYLRGHEGRGIGLVNKIRAYALQDRGLDTVEANEELGFPADLRDYAVAVQILGLLGAKRVRLLSNNPRKGVALERYGIAVAERLPLRIGPNPHNARYLETKRRKLGHDLLAAR